MPRARRVLLLVSLPLAASGCLPEREAGFTAPDPSARLNAIAAAAPEASPAEIRGLIGALESSDPAARLLAIAALERIAGTRLGYDHAAPEIERRAAVRRWVEWAEAQELAIAPAEADGGRTRAGDRARGEPGFSRPADGTEASAE